MSDTITAEQHDWVTRFCGVDTRAPEATAATDVSTSADGGAPPPADAGAPPPADAGAPPPADAGAPPPADAGAPPPADAGAPPPADAGAPAQKTVTITGPTTPAQTLKKEDATRVWGVDGVLTYTKAWAGGKPPPPLQAGVNLTFPTITIDLSDKGSWSFSVLNQPQFGLAADSTGVSGQAAINLFQAVWKDKYGPRLEADVQATLTNLKLDENPQFGGMAVLEFKLNDTFGVQAFLANQSDQKQGSKDFETNFSGGFQFVMHILKGPKN
jgi:hypothetical protein